MKIMVDIPEPQLQSLTDLAKAQGFSRSQLIRNAVDTYLAPHQSPKKDHRPLSEFIGLWTSEGDLPVDGLEYQDKLRSEW